MTSAQITRTLTTAPFQNFMIHIADGRTILIRHPEVVRLTGGGRLAIVENAEGMDEVIDVLMIVSLRPTNDRV
jgi:hypothetical protein